jgi:hypothetical protein
MGGVRVHPGEVLDVAKKSGAGLGAPVARPEPALAFVVFIDLV